MDSRHIKDALRRRARNLDRTRQKLHAEKGALEEIHTKRIRDIHVERGRKGGRAPKVDILTRIIESLVYENMSTGRKELLSRFEKMVNPLAKEGIISIINSDIEFACKGGKLREAPIKGLKDRLSNAKKALSQIAATSLARISLPSSAPPQSSGVRRAICLPARQLW